jgi:hypothetical protein
MAVSITINLLFFKGILFKMKNRRIHEPPNDIKPHKLSFHS